MVDRAEGGGPGTGHPTKGTTRTPGWHPERKEAQLPLVSERYSLTSVGIEPREGLQRPQCVKEKGPTDPGVAAPLAAVSCRGNRYYVTGGRSHASTRSSSSSHS